MLGVIRDKRTFLSFNLLIQSPSEHSTPQSPPREIPGPKYPEPRRARYPPLSGETYFSFI
ncbi:hypothetical protein T484DRAFT_1941984 [Baffinella frigidus]|nr:hypothetical protein T484DRAFT_1941984 [Cryptophyta sp. CCMP2293]